MQQLASPLACMNLAASCTIKTKLLTNHSAHWPIYMQHAVSYRGQVGKPYAPPVSGTEPHSARVGAILGRPVNTAAAWVFSFFVNFFSNFLFYYFFHGFLFPFLFFVLFLS
jgi:hypothetical protein